MPKTVIVGNLTDDPELHEVKVNDKLVSFIVMNVATVEIKNKNTQFFNIEYWGNHSKHYYNNAKKGALIEAECDIVNNNYVNKKGSHIRNNRFIAKCPPIILRKSRTRSLTDKEKSQKHSNSLTKDKTETNNNLKEDNKKMNHNEDNNFNFKEDYVKY